MKKTFICLSLIVFLFTSCFKKTETGLPPSSGRISEVLVVLPKQKWETAIGFNIKSLLMQDQEGLNQVEPIFELTQIQNTDFKGLFERQRKILRVFINDTITKDRLIAYKDVYSSPQIIAELHAKNDSAGIKLLHERAESLIEMFKQTERERLIKAFETTENKSMGDDIEDKFGFRITFPESYYLAKSDKNFAWFRLEAPKYSQAVMIYERDFTDSSQFSESQIIAYRNFVTKQFIPGEMPNSYMSTDTVFKPVMRVVPFANTKAIETRALWKTVGDFMGGCFLSYTLHNKKKNKVITLEGYVYYPNHEKRDLLMQLEAILNSYVEK